MHTLSLTTLTCQYLLYPPDLTVVAGARGKRAVDTGADPDVRRNAWRALGVHGRMAVVDRLRDGVPRALCQCCKINNSLRPIERSGVPRFVP